MSINQISQYLRGIPPDGPKPRYYFMYEDHFMHDAFRNDVMDKKAVTLGHLSDWTWHMNNNHQVNIRYTYKAQGRAPKGPVLAPANRFSNRDGPDGTYGLIFKITPDVQAMIDEIYADEPDKITMVQNIAFWLKTSNGRIVRREAEAMVYWDPFNTADGCRQNLLENSAQIKRWRGSIRLLLRCGVPHAWINTIQQRMAGLAVNPEPLTANDPRHPRPVLSQAAMRANDDYQQKVRRLGWLPNPYVYVQNATPSASSSSSSGGARTISPLEKSLSVVQLRSRTTSPVNQAHPTMRDRSFSMPGPKPSQALNNHSRSNSQVPSMQRPSPNIDPRRSLTPSHRNGTAIQNHRGFFSTGGNGSLSPTPSRKARRSPQIIDGVSIIAKGISSNPISPSPSQTQPNSAAYPRVRRPRQVSTQEAFALQSQLQHTLQSRALEWPASLSGASMQDQIRQGTSFLDVLRSNPRYLGKTAEERDAEIKKTEHYLKKHGVDTGGRREPSTSAGMGTGQGLKRRATDDGGEWGEAMSSQERKRRKREEFAGGKLKEGRRDAS